MPTGVYERKPYTMSVTTPKPEPTTEEIVEVLQNKRARVIRLMESITTYINEEKGVRDNG